jgi:hypothetical protein
MGSAMFDPGRPAITQAAAEPLGLQTVLLAAARQHVTGPCHIYILYGAPQKDAWIRALH